MTISRLAGLAVFLCSSAALDAGFVFFRSMPAEGTWAEWEVESGVDEPGKKTPLKLEAGKVFERSDRRLQILIVTGQWEDNDKPFTYRVEYEIDLAKLKADGHPGNAATLLKAWLPYDESAQPLKNNDPKLAGFKTWVIKCNDQSIDDSKKLSLTETALKKHDFKLLTGTINTSHFAGGLAPTSKFKAWICDEIPFGVGKWTSETNFKLGAGQERTIKPTAVLREFKKPGETKEPDSKAAKDEKGKNEVKEPSSKDKD